jgi:DNA-directed RNA polymerase specialized sigma24 family protein
VQARGAVRYLAVRYRKEEELSAVTETSPSPEGSVLAREVWTATSTLPGELRRALAGWCAGDTLQEIGDRDGVSRETARQRVAAAVRRVRDELALTNEGL